MTSSLAAQVTAETLGTGLELRTAGTNEREAEVWVMGDLCITDRTAEAFTRGEGAALFAALAADRPPKATWIANLECPLTRRGHPISKAGPTLSAFPECAEQLKRTGFDILTLANNHMGDMGADGVEDTLAACREAGLDITGAGMDLSAAGQPVFRKVEGIRVAVLAFAENEFGIATAEKAGANPLNLAGNFRAIKAARQEADVVLVALHAGNETYPLPRPGLVETCRFYIDCGADTVVCHHAHVPTGIEVYNEKPIFYGTGNFLFDWPEQRQAEWYEGYVVKLRFDRQGVTQFALVPYEQCRDAAGVTPLRGDARSNFLARIAERSRVIADAQELTNKWDAFCREKAVIHLATLFDPHPTLSRVRGRLYRLLRPTLRRAKRDLAYAIISCESHRELLLNILSRNDTDA